LSATDGIQKLRAAAERLDEIAAALGRDDTDDATAVELAREAAQTAAEAGTTAADAARAAAERGSEA
jgi:hypothetical protein